MEEDNHSHHSHHDEDGQEVEDPNLYTKNRVQQNEYAKRAAYEEKKLMYQVGAMVIISCLISLFFYMSLNSHYIKKQGATPALWVCLTFYVGALRNNFY